MGLTDYKARRKAVASRKLLLVVRISGKNVSAQFIKPQVSGDRVIASVHSHALRKLKWSGSLKSVPACYLLGLLAGKRAAGKGVHEAILYNGLAPFIGGARIAAFARGVSESGVKIPVAEEALPADSRLKGEPIAKYASALLKESKSSYQRRFSALLRAGFRPEDYPSLLEQTKQVILGGSKK